MPSHRTYKCTLNVNTLDRKIICIKLKKQTVREARSGMVYVQINGNQPNNVPQGLLQGAFSET